MAKGRVFSWLVFALGLKVCVPGYAQQPRQATLSQQKMCAEQARKFFLDPEMEHLGWTEYTSHYDAKRNVCYVMVRMDMHLDKQHSEEFHAIAFEVFDTFEGVQRALMQRNAIGPRKEPYACHVKPSGQEQIDCKTEDEFDALVMKYFGIERP